MNPLSEALKNFTVLCFLYSDQVVACKSIDLSIVIKISVPVQCIMYLTFGYFATSYGMLF